MKSAQNQKFRGRGRPRHDDVLTPGEWRIVQMVRHGLGNAQIARLRGISRDAVKFHVENAIAKLGLADRRALRAWRGIPKTSALYSLSRGNQTMTPLQLGTIGQISRSVKDIRRAEAWYRDVLGLPHLYTFGKLAFFDCGGTRLYLQESDAPGPESILYFKVSEMHRAHAELMARNVNFSGAPHMIHKHADGTEEWMAFFEDLEGRPLALMSQVKAG